MTTFSYPHVTFVIQTRSKSHLALYKYAAHIRILLVYILIYIYHNLTYSQQTQNICITFVQRQAQRRPTFYNCYTNVLCLLGYYRLSKGKTVGDLALKHCLVFAGITPRILIHYDTPGRHTYVYNSVKSKDSNCLLEQ